MATPIPTNACAFDTEALLDATGGRAVGMVPSASSIVTDSRAIVPGAAFVALRGARFDGHTHVAASLEAGAALAIVEREDALPAGRPGIVVPDTLRALGDLAAAHRRRVDRPVVAITGTAGKTGTRAFVAAALAADGGVVHATRGNLNNRIGLPMTVFSAPAEATRWVLEAGTNEPGEIAALAAIAQPDIAVITNVGAGHLEKLGSLDGVAREKTALFRGLVEGGVAVVNLDDARVVAGVPAGMRRRTFGRDARADVRILDASVRARGTRVAFAVDGARLDAELAAFGTGAAHNAAAALAVAIESGISAEDALAAIAAVAPSAGRARPLEGPGGVLIVDDAYNANPTSVREGLATSRALAEARGGRPHLVLGAMGELGEETASAHREVFELATDAAFGVRVFVGDAYRGLAESAGEPWFEAGEGASRIADVLRAGMGPGDTVLVKGSNALRLHEVVDALMKDERE